MSGAAAAGGPPQPVFRDANQVAVVVRDLDAAMRCYWEDYGIGPWAVLELSPGTMEGQTRDGEPAEHTFRIAVTRIGSLWWELIQPLDDHSIYARHLREHGESVHHVAVASESYEETLARLAALGRRNLQGGVIDGITHAYISTDEDLGVITEVYDWPADAVLRSPDRVYPEGAVLPPLPVQHGLVALIRDAWYPAWDSGDAERLERVTRDVFAADATIVAKPGLPPSRLEALLPGWVAEVATWRPQRHEILTAVESSGQAAWTMRWTATHAGPLHLADGRVVPATGETVEAEAAFFATWDGRRLTSFRAYSDFAAIVARLEQIAAG